MSVEPNYEQRKFDVSECKNKLQTVVAPKDKLEGDALPISQQAYIYRTDLDEDNSVALKPKNTDNGFYIFVVNGSVEVSGNSLNKRDAIGIWDTENFEVTTHESAEVIIIEVPMN